MKEVESSRSSLGLTLIPDAASLQSIVDAPAKDVGEAGLFCRDRSLTGDWVDGALPTALANWGWTLIGGRAFCVGKEGSAGLRTDSGGTGGSLFHTVLPDFIL